MVNFLILHWCYDFFLDFFHPNEPFKILFKNRFRTQINFINRKILLR